ncbi:MAG: hypothetical protein R3C58_00240 [Parvularculaceae bacterium]
MTRALILIAFAASSTAAHAEVEPTVPFEDVPEKVRDVAIITAPGVTFDRVSVEIENGVTIYEFEAKDHNGKHIEIDVTEDAVLEEIEMETALEDVPAIVLKTLEKTAPGFVATYIELSVRENGGLFVYEFEGVAGSRQLDIEIAESGELMVVSDLLAS